MNKTPFFISTAIDYPSAKVHLGHALEKVQADVIARYKRLQGFEVHFSTGVDQHGLKIQRCAEKAGKNPQEFVDEMSQYFKNAWDALNISYDDFIQTTEKRHQRTVQEIIKKIYEKGDIYKGRYKGLYCVDCESYYLPKDLVNGKCPIHHKPLETIEEESYFFRMSKYQKQLLKHIKENKSFIIPESRRNEILNRLKEPLQDLSISRKAVKWGIPLPFDKEKVLFVWIDALINYLTTIDYPKKNFQKFWPADIHVIGKDITWHHSVIWGSLLLSLGLPLPKTILVHGFITVEGQKMSKSLGNVIDPFELVEKYGQDAVRYYLLREIPTTKDGDFSYSKFEKRYNDDLAKGLGNLVARVIGIARKLKTQNSKLKTTTQNAKLQNIVKIAQRKYHKAIEEFKLNEALAIIWELIGFCDKYIEEKRLWEEKEENKQEIGNLVETIKEIAKLLEPFLPKTSEKIVEQLETGDLTPLFPRL